MQRRKPKSALRSEQVRIRVTRDQKRRLVTAAHQAGLGVSSWLRAVGLQKAEEEQTKKR